MILPPSLSLAGNPPPRILAVDDDPVFRRSVAFAAGKLGRVGPHLPPRDDVLALAAKAEVRVLRL